MINDKNIYNKNLQDFQIEWNRLMKEGIDLLKSMSGAGQKISGAKNVKELSNETNKLNETQKKYVQTVEKAIKIENELTNKTNKQKDADYLLSKAKIQQREETKKLNQQIKEELNLTQKQTSFTKKLGGALKGAITSVIGITAAIAASVKGIKAFIKLNVEFQKSLSSLQAITGLGRKEMSFFAKEAKKTSAETLQSATEIVKAYELVGSAQPELLKNKEALAAVTKEAIILSEATGGNLGLVDAAKSATGVMNQMGLAANEARRVINTLAAGSKAGAAAIPELSEGYKQFGAVLGAANGTVEDGVALQEVLAEKQILGAEAGTKLRNILIELQKDQNNYKNGTFDLDLALKNLNAENATAVELTDKFGKQNVVAAQILAKNYDGFVRYKNAVTNTNTALEQQAIQNDNLASNWRKLINIITNKFIMGGFSSALNNIVKSLINFSKKVTEFRNNFVNDFNDLIKESAVFRGIIISIGNISQLVFRTFGETIKDQILIFKTLGQVIVATFTLRFSEIDDIVKEGLGKLKENVINFKDDFISAFSEIKDAINGNYDDLLLKQKENEQSLNDTITSSTGLIKKINSDVIEFQKKYLEERLKINEKILEDDLRIIDEEINADNERIRKKIENTQKEIDNFKKRAEIANNYAQEVGSILGKSIVEGENALKEASKQILLITLKTIKGILQQQVIASTTSATIQSLASPESVATSGIAGLAKSGILVVLIEAAYAGVEALLESKIPSFFKGGKHKKGLAEVHGNELIQTDKGSFFTNWDKYEGKVLNLPDANIVPNKDIIKYDINNITELGKSINFNGGISKNEYEKLIKNQTKELTKALSKNQTIIKDDRYLIQKQNQTIEYFKKRY